MTSESSATDAVTEPADEAGTDEAGTDEAGTDEAGTDEAGTDEAGTDEAGTDEAGTDEAGVGEGEGEGGEGTLLEREGDIAADYLEVLLDIADLDGDIDIDVEGDRAAVSVVGDGLERLIGPEGATLDALQELTRLSVHRVTGVRSRLMLDVGGHRARRRAELSKLGAEAAQRVADTGETERLDPMTPFERKIVHDAVAEVDGVETESEGEEPQRRIVIRKV
jgi:spoIIIJ-associated protein